MRPLAIDLFCGLGGWTEGLLAEGYRVVGFDIERHRYPARSFSLDDESSKGMGGKNKNGTTLIGAAREQVHGFHTAPLTGELAEYPAQLVLQDVLTIHGRQFKDAALIVASPPCQEYSYMAMPWSIAKQKARDYETGVRDVKQLTALFDACFRIQREACEASGRYIPLVVENVRGAQRWVGRSRYHFGSFHLWGDVPALMPMQRKAIKGHGGSWFKDSATADVKYGPGNFRIGVDGQENSGKGARFTSRDCGHEAEGVKQGGDWFNASQPSISRKCGSKSAARKAASAQIAKIPMVLSRHVAKAWKPEALEASVRRELFHWGVLGDGNGPLLEEGAQT